MKNHCTSETETEHFAAKMAKNLHTGDVLLLRGPLGAGKSVFARALIRALTQTPTLEIPSPTFTLVQTYESPHGMIYHYDLYRLKKSEEVFELGWEEARAEGITIAEWPERLGIHTPPHALDIEIKALDNEPLCREILVKDTR